MFARIRGAFANLAELHFQINKALRRLHGHGKDTRSHKHVVKSACIEEQ
jgi:hypothetical protein